MSTRAVAIVEADPEGKSFEYYNWHFGGYDRRQHDIGRVAYNPINFGEVPDYYRRFIDHVDVACIKVAPMEMDAYDTELEENEHFTIGQMKLTNEELLLEDLNIPIDPPPTEFG